MDRSNNLISSERFLFLAGWSAAGKIFQGQGESTENCFLRRFISLRLSMENPVRSRQPHMCNCLSVGYSEVLFR